MNGILIYRQIPIINNEAVLPDNGRVPIANVFNWSPPIVHFKYLSKSFNDGRFLESLSGSLDLANEEIETLKTTNI